MGIKLAGTALILLIVCLRTLAYALYQKSQGNKAGAYGLFILSFLALAVPLYVVWVRA